MTIVEKLQTWLTAHPPTAAEVEKYNVIRDSALEFAVVLVENTPVSADQTAALRKLRECVMTANAAIACKGV